MSFSDQISCIDEVLTSEAYVHRGQNTFESHFGYKMFVKMYLPRQHTFEPSPDFEVGDWKLPIEARGWGENTIGAFQDNWLIIVITVHRVCQQYPIEPPCDE